MVLSVPLVSITMKCARFATFATFLLCALLATPAYAALDQCACVYTYNSTHLNVQASCDATLVASGEICSCPIFGTALAEVEVVCVAAQRRASARDVGRTMLLPWCDEVGGGFSLLTGCGATDCARGLDVLYEYTRVGSAQCSVTRTYSSCYNDAVSGCDCVQSDFELVTGCNATCESDGVELYRRSVVRNATAGGAACGPAERTVACASPEACLVVSRDCQYSAFSAWGICEPTCGLGTQRRTRTVVQDAAGGGEPCDISTLEETRACGNRTCPQQCLLSAWSEWSDCASEVCEGNYGNQTRTRSVVQAGYGCQALRETRRCRLDFSCDPLTPKLTENRFFACAPGESQIVYNSTQFPSCSMPCAEVEANGHFVQPCFTDTGAVRCNGSTVDEDVFLARDFHWKRGDNGFYDEVTFTKCMAHAYVPCNASERLAVCGFDSHDCHKLVRIMNGTNTTTAWFDGCTDVADEETNQRSSSGLVSVRACTRQEMQDACTLAEWHCAYACDGAGFTGNCSFYYGGCDFWDYLGNQLGETLSQAQARLGRRATYPTSTWLPDYEAQLGYNGTRPFAINCTEEESLAKCPREWASLTDPNKYGCRKNKLQHSEAKGIVWEYDTTLCQDRYCTPREQLLECGHYTSACDVSCMPDDSVAGSTSPTRSFACTVTANCSDEWRSERPTRRCYLHSEYFLGKSCASQLEYCRLECDDEALTTNCDFADRCEAYDLGGNLFLTNWTYTRDAGYGSATPITTPDILRCPNLQRKSVVGPWRAWQFGITSNPARGSSPVFRVYVKADVYTFAFAGTNYENGFITQPNPFLDARAPVLDSHECYDYTTDDAVLYASPRQQQAACGSVQTGNPWTGERRYVMTNCRRDSLVAELGLGTGGPGSYSLLEGRVFNHVALAPFTLDNGNAYNHTDCAVWLPKASNEAYNDTCTSEFTPIYCSSGFSSHSGCWHKMVNYFQSFLQTKPARICTHEEWINPNGTIDNCAVRREDCRVVCDDLDLTVNCSKEFVCYGYSSLTDYAWDTSPPVTTTICSDAQWADVTCTLNRDHCRVIDGDVWVYCEDIFDEFDNWPDWVPREWRACTLDETSELCPVPSEPLERPNQCYRRNCIYHASNQTFTGCEYDTTQCLAVECSHLFQFEGCGDYTTECTVANRLTSYVSSLGGPYQYGLSAHITSDCGKGDLPTSEPYVFVRDCTFEEWQQYSCAASPSQCRMRCNSDCTDLTLRTGTIGLCDLSAEQCILEQRCFPFEDRYLATPYVAPGTPGTLSATVEQCGARWAEDPDRTCCEVSQCAYTANGTFVCSCDTDKCGCPNMFSNDTDACADFWKGKVACCRLFPPLQSTPK